MRPRTWKVLAWGDVPPATTQLIPWVCACGSQALLPAVGRVIAITGHEIHGDTGVTFDDRHHALPHTIQCRTCHRVMALVDNRTDAPLAARKGG